jgi:hypothetical protein
MEGIHQSVSDHRINQLQRAHFLAIPHMRRMRRHTHRFLTACDNNRGISISYCLKSQRHGAQA